jgi:hypothetical protein
MLVVFKCGFGSCPYDNIIHTKGAVMKKPKDKTDLQIIPGVGPSIKKDLLDIGIKNVHDLNGKNPETLYKNLCKKRNIHIDRCVLYVFRCAVYFAEKKSHDPELLKWWNWKDK